MSWRMVAAIVVLGPALWCGLNRAGAQFSPKQSYSDYFNKQVTTYRRPSVNPARTTYDRYFYNNPAVSPYSNLMRPSGQYVPNYQTYVRPEAQRRASLGAVSPTIGPTAPSPFSGRGALSSRATTGSRPSQYHNHWYGQRLGGR